MKIIKQDKEKLQWEVSDALDTINYSFFSA